MAIWMKINEQMYEICRLHQAGRSCQHAGETLANRRGLSQKDNTTISTNSAKFQQSQDQKLSVQTWRGKSYRQRTLRTQSVTTAVSDVELQQKSNSCPCADSRRSSLLWTLNSQWGLHWRSKPKMTCFSRVQNTRWATAHHPLKVTLKRSLSIVSNLQWRTC